MKPLRVLIACSLAVGASLLGSCATNGPTEPPPDYPVCDGPVTIIVSGDSIPQFSWEPQCKLGRLLVMEVAEERWGTETLGYNVWPPPITYNVHPPDSENKEPGRELFPGTTYRVDVYRWVGPDLDVDFELLGSQEFTY